MSKKLLDNKTLAIILLVAALFLFVSIPIPFVDTVGLAKVAVLVVAIVLLMK